MEELHELITKVGWQVVGQAAEADPARLRNKKHAMMQEWNRGKVGSMNFPYHLPVDVVVDAQLADALTPYLIMLGAEPIHLRSLPTRFILLHKKLLSHAVLMKRHYNDTIYIMPYNLMRFLLEKQAWPSQSTS